MGLACLVIVENPPRRSAIVPPLGVVLVVAPVAAYVDLSPTLAVVLAAALGGGYLALARLSDGRAWWSLPVVAFAAALGVSAATAESARPALIATGTIVGIVLASAWGPLPWSSRVVGRFASRLTGMQWPTLLLATIGSTVLAVTAVVGPTEHRRAFASSSVALVALGVLATTLAVRLWRFAPHRRAFDLVVLTATSVVALLLQLPLTENGVPTAVIAVTLCATAVAFVAVPFALLNAHGQSVGAGTRGMPRWPPGKQSNPELPPHERQSTTSLGAAADRRLPPNGDQRRDDGCGPGQT
jgi:hypothetical protein